VILSSLDDYIARQPSPVTRKRQLLPVVGQRMQIAEGLAKHLERLGLERRAKDVDLAALHAPPHVRTVALSTPVPSRSCVTSEVLQSQGFEA
jgi:hypothetical protein